MVREFSEYYLIRLYEYNTATKSTGPAEAHEQLQKPKKLQEGAIFTGLKGSHLTFTGLSQETEPFFTLKCI